MTDAEISDHQLLHDYVEQRSGSAFAELVRRHVDAVYSSALRRANGERAMAEDIVQCVFTDFARKAAQFPAGTVPGGWLHRHTGFVASHHIDRERRHRSREQQAVAMNALTNSPEDAAWQRTAPLLDAALDSLPAPDRDAIVLRFFEKRDLRSVGHALGVSDDTAQKRVGRALEKLRSLLTRRGVTSTGAALSAIMLAHTVSPAPASLVSVLSGRALAGAATAGGTLAAAGAGLSTVARWKLAGLAAAIAVAGAAPVFFLEAPQATASSLSSIPSVPSVLSVPSAPPGPPPAKTPPPAAPQSLSEIITAAAAELRGGAQNISAITRALGLLTQIPAAQSSEALGLISGVPDESARSLLYKYFLSHWAETDPWRALQFATEELPGQHRLATSEGVLAAWAARDPEAVFAWDQKTRGSKAPPQVRDSLMAVLFKTLASRDLPKAFIYLNNVDRPNDRAHALRGILDTVQTPQDRERVLDAIASTQDSELRVQARRAVVETWARQDPAAAAAWVDNAEPAWERPRLMDSLGLTWLQNDPAKAAAWWIAREPGPDTLVKIINIWSQEDPKEASKWLDVQPPGLQSDTARMTFARQVSEREPDSALHWAATVSDESMRENTIDHIFKNWAARDAAAANSFLKASGWPAERLSRLQTLP